MYKWMNYILFIGVPSLSFSFNFCRVEERVFRRERSSFVDHGPATARRCTCLPLQLLRTVGLGQSRPTCNRWYGQFHVRSTRHRWSYLGTKRSTLQDIPLFPSTVVLAFFSLFLSPVSIFPMPFFMSLRRRQ